MATLRKHQGRFADAVRAVLGPEPESYFHRHASLSETEARNIARRIWTTINGVNLRENILPTRTRADLILEKGPDHATERVQLRKI